MTASTAVANGSDVEHAVYRAAGGASRVGWGEASCLALAAALERGEVDILDPTALAAPWSHVAQLAQGAPRRDYEGAIGFARLLTPGWCAGAGVGGPAWVEERFFGALAGLGAEGTEYLADRAKLSGEQLHHTPAYVAATRAPVSSGDVCGGPVVVTACDIEPEAVAWWWPGRIGLGKLTILEGDPDVGKSTVLLDLAARVTRGAPMPDGTPAPYGPGGILILAADEDGIADTIVPRLDAAGADLGRAHVWKGTPTDTAGYLRGFEITEADLAAVEQVVIERGVRLVVIDALMATVPTSTNAHRDTDLRRLLHPLAAMAERTGCAVIANRHHRKGGGRAIDRGGGSMAVNAVARASLAVVRDPDDETGERRILGIVKANLLAQADRASMVFRIVGAQVTNRAGGVVETSRVEWLGKDARTLDEVLALGDDTERASVTADCAGSLREFLADGPMLADDVIAKLRGEEFSPSAIRRARQIVGVTRDAGTIYQRGFRGPYMWALEPPTDAPTDATGALPL